MINLEDLDRAVLTFIDDTHETIVVEDIIVDTNGHPRWIEGYAVNVVGRMPNPTTLYPWHAIKYLRPLYKDQ